MPFVQVVELTAASAEKKKRLLEALAPLSKSTFESEPESSTYYWYEPVEGDGLTIHGLEYYGSKELTEAHMKDPVFTTFITTVTKEELLSAPPMIQQAVPVAGFLTRPNAPNHGNAPDAFIWAGKFLTHPGKADEVVEALKENIPYIESSEPETISFVVLKGVDEADTVYVWERYATESALRDVHHKSTGYANLRESTGPLMKNRNINGYKELTGFLTKEGGMV